jgi:mannose-6-phosphate isomerase-like protein (cupin superfamily)
MSESDRSCVIPLKWGHSRIPGPAGEHSVSFFQRGTLNVKLSHPPSPNTQTPHAQDEIYIVARGRGILFHDGKRDPFEAGDLLFIAAGTEHHFEDFSNDLALWVIFYVPTGGEVPVRAV